MNIVRLNLPTLPEVKLRELRQGDTFLIAKQFYSEHAFVYMVLKNTYTNTVNVVRLQDGSIEILGSNLKVVALTVTLNCKVREPSDDLPF